MLFRSIPEPFDWLSENIAMFDTDKAKFTESKWMKEIKHTLSVKKSLFSAVPAIEILLVPSQAKACWSRPLGSVPNATETMQDKLTKIMLRELQRKSDEKIC